MRVLRLVAVSYWLHLKMIAVSVFEGVFQVIWPIYFATVAFLLYGRSDEPGVLVYAGLGAAVMGIWSVVTTTASGLLQRERWLGTLELLVASPTRFALVLVPITTAMASLGLFSLVSTLLWAWLLFGITVPVASPLAFVVSILVSVFSVALLGFLLSVAVVRYRTAWAMGNLLEYPGWLLCGFLVPLTLFPSWVSWISYALPPTWGMQAIRASAHGESPWLDVVMCLLVGLVYGVVGALLSETVLRSARRHATLSLT
ncbi:ABC transporter permease [Nocardioides iriomotensis]|jgi:ABC-2 type transport system permease protein|uniref:ABC transporter permease n=1 Tax=Nocardioides iriomotensis TaxID=715784 RepID=A0A4Q5J6R9_9ACTN|nr:ABC transporter permease [Nocardioides iriomotensis]RYU13381.1 ABC transporter permease [Nocardioides iriomotensis]